MEIPYEWTEDSYLFDFNSMPSEELSDYIDYIFRKRWYVLDKGTPVDGFYSKSQPVSGLNPNHYTTVELRYKVEIYSSGGKTYLEIFRAYGGFPMDINEKLWGNKYLNIELTELNKIVNQIKFLKPSIKGYLVCNKCGAYYEVHKEESYEDFPDKCECGGTFKYIVSPKQPDKKTVKRTKTARPTEYLRAPAAIILVSLACLAGFADVTDSGITFLIGLSGLTFGMCFVLMRYRSHELVLNMIYRRLIYLLAAVLFFGGSWVLIIVLIQIDNYSVTMIEFSLFTIIAVIFGLGMILKTINPEDPRNFLDPPL